MDTNYYTSDWSQTQTSPNWEWTSHTAWTPHISDWVMACHFRDSAEPWSDFASVLSILAGITCLGPFIWFCRLFVCVSSRKKSRLRWKLLFKVRWSREKMSDTRWVGSWFVSLSRGRLASFLVLMVLFYQINYHESCPDTFWLTQKSPFTSSKGHSTGWLSSDGLFSWGVFFGCLVFLNYHRKYLISYWIAKICVMRLSLKTRCTKPPPQ